MDHVKNYYLSKCIRNSFMLHKFFFYEKLRNYNISTSYMKIMFSYMYNNVIVVFCPFHQNIRSGFSLRKAILTNSLRKYYLTYVDYTYDRYVSVRHQLTHLRKIDFSSLFYMLSAHLYSAITTVQRYEYSLIHLRKNYIIAFGIGVILLTIYLWKQHIYYSIHHSR